MTLEGVWWWKEGAAVLDVVELTKQKQKGAKPD